MCSEFFKLRQNCDFDLSKKFLQKFVKTDYNMYQCNQSNQITGSHFILTMMGLTNLCPLSISTSPFFGFCREWPCHWIQKNAKTSNQEMSVSFQRRSRTMVYLDNLYDSTWQKKLYKNIFKKREIEPLAIPDLCIFRMFCASSCFGWVKTKVLPIMTAGKQLSLLICSHYARLLSSVNHCKFNTAQAATTTKGNSKVLKDL